MGQEGAEAVKFGEQMSLSKISILFYHFKGYGHNHFSSLSKLINVNFYLSSHISPSSVLIKFSLYFSDIKLILLEEMALDWTFFS